MAENPTGTTQTASATAQTDEEGVDEHGIPRVVKHCCQNMFNPVWRFIHKLSQPIPGSKEPTRPYTHICIVCCDEHKSSDPTASTWRNFLMRPTTSSNARKHMWGAHKEHSFTLETKRRKTSDVAKRIQTYDSGASGEQGKQPNQKKQRTIHEAIAINADQMKILSTRWLLSSGLPHTVLQNPELLELFRRLAHQPALLTPARDTFYEFAKAEWHLLIKLVSDTLSRDFSKAKEQPFITMLHDLWTNASNMNIIGVTVVFVDSEWRLVTLSLLAMPNSHGHAAGTVADLIKARMQDRYNIDVDRYVRFTVSDTTGSARNVFDHFNITDQVDCLMHLLSLCLLYALGLKENTRNRGQSIITPGGEFRNGLKVIQKLRDLATFFNTPQRITKLKQIKKALSLPAVNIEVDSKTRVGYAVTLMRRSVLNHYAFAQYFEGALDSETAVWSSISKDDWALITEMEGLTNQLAQFSLGEVQKQGVASSYVLLFRKMLVFAGESTTVNCLVLDRPGPKATEHSQRRAPKSISEFSWDGKRCRDRLREQLALRFSVEDPNDIKALLLDPRIKGKAHSIVSDSSVLAQAETELQFEHALIYQKLFARQAADEECKGKEPLPSGISQSSSDLIDTALGALLEIDAPAQNVEMSDFQADLSAQAMNAWNEWKNLNVSRPCSTSQTGKYNLLDLYRNVDILAWFKESGQLLFPGIAVLARIYLAKPMLAAIQERFFSLSGYVVNDLRTRLDEDRAEMLCLMKANWREYRSLQKQTEVDSK